MWGFLLVKKEVFYFLMIIENTGSEKNGAFFLAIFHDPELSLAALVGGAASFCAKK